MDVHPPNPALDAFMVLVSVLHQRGVIDETAMAMIVERLELSEHHDIADRVMALPFMNLLDPRSDGGNTGG